MWIAVGISEITAIGVYAQYWFPHLPQWIPALAAVAIVAAANLAAVKLYGEMEFWFALIKITTIIVMIVVGLAVIFFGFGNHGQAIGFDNLTVHGGFFAAAYHWLCEYLASQHYNPHSSRYKALHVHALRVAQEQPAPFHAASDSASRYYRR